MGMAGISLSPQVMLCWGPSQEALRGRSVLRAKNDASSLEGIDTSPVKAKPPLPFILTNPSRYAVASKLKLALSKIVMMTRMRAPMTLRLAIKRMLGRA